KCSTGRGVRRVGAASRAVSCSPGRAGTTRTASHVTASNAGFSSEFGLARAVLCIPRIMEWTDRALARAEFEEAWAEVEYHEGRASLADVQAAIARVNAVRRLIAKMQRAQHTGRTFPWRAPRTTAPASH